MKTINRALMMTTSQALMKTTDKAAMEIINKALKTANVILKAVNQALSLSPVLVLQ